MKLSFHGAAQMVTGSCYLLEVNGMNLMVDCGMFQGGDNPEELNRKHLPFEVSSIDFLILTHAHIDHSGRLPWLIANGFRGKIIATEPTIQLSELMLIDSARIQEYDFKKGRIAVPLYTVEDAVETLNFFQPLDYATPRKLSDSVEVELFDAGHILGSSIVQLKIKENGEERVVVFSGDLGHPGQRIVKDPTILNIADYVIVESTYGNRIHLPREKSVEILHEELESGESKGGNVIVPSFAVERTQELLYDLNHFYENGEFTQYPVYFDTPLGISATKVYAGFEKYYDEDALKLVASGDDPYEFPNLITLRGGRSRRGYSSHPKTKGIIIAGSGMCTGGKVIGYLKKNISNPNSSVIFIGYQAEGTLGRQIQENEGTVTIEGKVYDVRARIKSISGFSAHGDQSDLLNWVNSFDKRRLKKVFVTHGEIDSSNTLASLINESQVQTHIPQIGEKVTLE